jgi:homogentisate 1,2-dioxygenase
VVGAFAATEDSPLYRSSVGDELLFLREGRLTLESTFGRLAVGPGDYVVVPTATVHRWVVEQGPAQGIVAEARGHVRVPSHHLGPEGQFLEGSPFCERDLRAPEELVDGGDEPAEVVVRSRAGLSVHAFAHHPFDVVGWDGGCYPFAFNVWDFEPIVGRFHQPPPVHQTFSAPGFVVVSFTPRLFDFDPTAVKVPYHHANVDTDEVIYYASGNFMSRRGSGIEAGSITLHPTGHVHGPQPGSLEGSMGVDRTEEVAVNIDTVRPLLLADPGRAVEVADYPWTWARPNPFPPLERPAGG